MRWPTEKLTALRLGRQLVTEVPASKADRRAFVDITPVRTPADSEADQDHWTRTDHNRTFRVQHWEYHAGRVDGLDYDVGSVLIREATAAGEAELMSTLEAWRLHPDRFLYPWETDDPR